MKNIFFLFITFLFIKADDSFITEYEYGQMLYNNPRGIGCVHCHGKDGSGALIAKYKEDGKTKSLRGPNIRNTTIKELKKSLFKRHRVMPTYFLTDSEIEALSYFLSNKGE